MVGIRAINMLSRGKWMPTDGLPLLTGERKKLSIVSETRSVLLVLFACVALPCNFALAQGGQQSSQPAAKPSNDGFVPTKRPFKRDKDEFAVQDFKTPPELPGLPAFPVGPRAEFQSGQLAPNTHSGQIYTLTYRAKDPGPIILNWYEQALRGQWNATRLDNMINAEMNNGNGVRCNVFLLRATKAGFQTNFIVLYTIPAPKKK